MADRDAPRVFGFARRRSHHRRGALRCRLRHRVLRQGPSG
jgi:hypothetical protein